MDCYIGTKIVKAEPMDDVTFVLKVREIPGRVPTVEADGRGAPGYLVRYEDGYTSWSPRDTFERAYRRVTDAEAALIVIAQVPFPL